MMRFTKHLRSPLFLCFVFLVLLTVVSGLVLNRSRSPKPDITRPGWTGTISSPGETREVQISINGSDEILLNEDVVSRRELRPTISELTTGSDPVKFTLKNSEGASYTTYVEVYDALRDVITDLRAKAAMQELGKPYATLSRLEKTAIDELYPLKVNEIFIAGLERD